MTHQHATLEDTVYFWFGANDTSGSGGDGASPVYDVRLAGAAAGAAPVLSGSATLLSHGDYPAGAHEIAIAATDGNGFAADATYAVFVTLLVDSQNPTGFAGSFTLGPIVANVTQWKGETVPSTTQTGVPKVDVDYVGGGAFTGASNFEAAFNGTGYAFTSCVIPTVTTTGTATALGANAVDSTSIADNAITAAKINADAITNAKIADDAIAAENLKTGAISADAFAADALVAATFAASSLDGKGDWNTVEPDPAGTAPTATEIVDEWETQSQADPTGFQVNTMEIEGTDATDTLDASAAAALVAIHLDHLFAATYDATSKPGVADALWNEMVEDDGGLTRYTANALEQAPGGSSSATLANQVLILESVQSSGGSGT